MMLQSLIEFIPNSRNALILEAMADLHQTPLDFSKTNLVVLGRAPTKATVVSRKQTKKRFFICIQYEESSAMGKLVRAISPVAPRAKPTRLAPKLLPKSQSKVVRGGTHSLGLVAGHALRTWRKVSTSTLAQVLGVHPSTILKNEKREFISDEMAQRLWNYTSFKATT